MTKKKKKDKKVKEEKDKDVEMKQIWPPMLKFHDDGKSTFDEKTELDMKEECKNMQCKGVIEYKRKGYDNPQNGCPYLHKREATLFRLWTKDPEKYKGSYDGHTIRKPLTFWKEQMKQPTKSSCLITAYPFTMQFVKTYERVMTREDFKKFMIEKERLLIDQDEKQTGLTILNIHNSLVGKEEKYSLLLEKQEIVMKTIQTEDWKLERKKQIITEKEKKAFQNKKWRNTDKGKVAHYKSNLVERAKKSPIDDEETETDEEVSIKIKKPQIEVKTGKFIAIDVNENTIEKIRNGIKTTVTDEIIKHVLYFIQKYCHVWTPQCGVEFQQVVEKNTQNILTLYHGENKRQHELSLKTFSTILKHYWVECLQVGKDVVKNLTMSSKRRKYFGVKLTVEATKKSKTFPKFVHKRKREKEKKDADDKELPFKKSKKEKDDSSHSHVNRVMESCKKHAFDSAHVIYQLLECNSKSTGSINDTVYVYRLFFPNCDMSKFSIENITLDFEQHKMHIGPFEYNAKTELSIELANKLQLLPNGREMIESKRTIHSVIDIPFDVNMTISPRIQMIESGVIVALCKARLASMQLDRDMSDIPDADEILPDAIEILPALERV